MYQSFGAGEVKPHGWLLKQLEIQAAGLSGNLDKAWPDVRDSAWIGGACEGWERVPYWLDGFIPLAYLTENEDMISRAGKYITSIIERQQEDGWICPCREEEREKYDAWAFFLIGKVLALYCEFTEDIKAEKSLYRAMKCLHKLLQEEKIKLFNWGKFRWFECMIPLQFLYDRYKEEWILELARVLKEQGADYFDYVDTWKRPLNKWTFHTHIVNLCMMFKYEAVYCELLGLPYENKAEELWQILETYNGTAVGTFTGDECLSGIANNQGTELCAVVELMYSCEVLYRLTGDAIWAERLEKAAFNALPATLSDDMWSHQYDQMVNQIACVTFPGKSFFRTNSADAHLFGLEPHYGCCTANFNQGWPKLVMHIFKKTTQGIECAHMLPVQLSTVWNGVPVNVDIATEYPFRHSAEYTVTAKEPVEFTLQIRIPKWSGCVKINGEVVKAEGMYTIHKIWQGTEKITVELSDIPHFVERPFDLKVVEYGPLVFALPIEEEYRRKEYERDGVERKYPYCDYELLPQSQWRYGFAGDTLMLELCEGDDIPFSSKHPRLTVKALLSPVEWDYAEGYDTVAAKYPHNRAALEEARELQLFPYGCAKLRMTELPRVTHVQSYQSND